MKIACKATRQPKQSEITNHIVYTKREFVLCIMVAYDVDSVDDSSRSYNNNNSVRLSYNRYNHEDRNHEHYDDNDGDDIEENHSFRTMSRLMLLDSTSARSDATTITTPSTKHKKPLERRTSSSGSAAGGIPEQLQQQQQQQQQDIYETGQWGVISRRDKICFIMTLILLVCGIVMAFVFATAVVGGGGSKSDSSMASNSPMGDTSSKTPTFNGGSSNGMDSSGTTDVVPGLKGTSIGVNRNKNETMYYTVKEQYDALRAAISTLAPEAIVSQILLHIPENINEFETKFDNDLNSGTGTDDIYQRAMSWFLYNDTVTIKHESELVARFVLVVTYFNNGGASQTWMNSEHWMTSYHVCLWYGVQCNHQNHNSNQNNIEIIEIDLSDNGLDGSIHLAWTLLDKCKSILFNSNQLNGTIPGTVFGNILSLEYLYLQNNLLSGTIPETLKSITSIHTTTSSLSTLFVQGNSNLTGAWPIKFCPSSSSNDISDNATTGSTDSSNEIRPIYSYGMDCNAIQCSCCDPSLHCFN